MWGILRAFENVRLGYLRAWYEEVFASDAQIFAPNAQVFAPNAQVFEKNVRKRSKTFENIRKRSKIFEKLGEIFENIRLFCYPPARLMRSGQFAVLSFEF